MLSLALAATSLALSSSNDEQERRVGQALAVSSFVIALLKLGEQ